MSYIAGTSNLSQQIAQLKQGNLDGSAPVATSASTTASFGKIYEVSGSTAITITAPGAPTSGEGFFAVKILAGSTATVTVSGSGLTFDGAATFTMSGAGGSAQENGFVIGAGATNYDIN